MAHFWTVVEKQLNNGVPAAITTHYDTETAALAAYFTVCAAAAVSSIEYHAAHIIRDDGIMTEGRVFDRREETGLSTGGGEA